jgi:hypothetical protein
MHIVTGEIFLTATAFEDQENWRISKLFSGTRALVAQPVSGLQVLFPGTLSPQQFQNGISNIFK